MAQPRHSVAMWQGVLGCLLTTAFRPARANLYPGVYQISNPNTVSKATFSTEYKAEYFDVYSQPIRTRYSEVYWMMQDPLDIPDEIKKRFDNKTMAVIGYEVDQVRKTADGSEVGVPITDAYNHHYGAYLNSKYAPTMEEYTTDPHHMGMSCGVPGGKSWRPVVVDGAPPSDEDIAVSQFFSEGNGGEMRGSFHGYPKGFAQLIDSPVVLRLVPMQIDTKNRDFPGPGFRPGILPRSAKSPPNASYSGILECPCTTRTKREWSMTYSVQDNGTCQQPVQNASECFSAAPTLVKAAHYTQRNGSDPSLPAGCTVQSLSADAADIFWNTNGSAVPCGGGPGTGRVVAVVQSIVNITVDLQSNASSEAVTITLSGPADVWFGVGFGADSMCLHMVADECQGGGPYTIVVSSDGDQGVTERKLELHAAGRVLQPSVAVKSSTVANGTRTVVLTRALQGASADHFTFDPKAATVSIINAKGGSMVFAQHVDHAASVLNFAAVGKRSCVCQAGVRGSINGASFPDSPCMAEPRGDLLKQNNPTCFVQTYSGGLRCCVHGQYLLDADQTPPDDYQEYYLKFRFWFEEYVPGPGASHQNLVRLYYQTEANAGEYDIVQCAPGTPAQDCIQVITARWKVSDMLRDCPVRQNGGDWTCTGVGSTDPEKTAGVNLIYAGPHCHAPDCLSMELYNADTGRLLCHVEPTYGTSDTIYDEKGYLALPPCLWGKPEEGLMEPELLGLDTELLSIKRNNNTYGHYGEMASWQMRGIVVPKQPVQPVVKPAEELPQPALDERLARRWALTKALHDGMLV